jgi:hypothetical protein
MGTVRGLTYDRCSCYRLYHGCHASSDCCEISCCHNSSGYCRGIFIAKVLPSHFATGTDNWIAIILWLRQLIYFAGTLGSDRSQSTIVQSFHRDHLRTCDHPSIRMATTVAKQHIRLAQPISKTLLPPLLYTAMGQSGLEPYCRWSGGRACSSNRHSYRADKCWLRWRGACHYHELQYELDEPYQVLDNAGNVYGRYLKDQVLRQGYGARKRTRRASRAGPLLASTGSH